MTTVPSCPPSGSCPYSSIADDLVATGYEGISAGGAQFATAIVAPATGAPNSAFGGGLVSTGLGGPGATAEATGVAVYPACPAASPSCPWAADAGDVVVVGTVTPESSSQTDVRVVEYSPAGGVVWSTDVTPAGYASSGPPSVALDVTGPSADGDVIVAGSVQLAAGGAQEPLLAALNPSGSTDATFGAGGEGVELGYIHTGGGTPLGQWLSGVTVDPSGDIVVAGTSIDSSGNAGIVIARYTSLGALDDRFGSPAGCAPSAKCSGATEVAGGDVSAGVGLAPQAASSCGSGWCYDVLVAGTSVPAGGASSPVVAAVDETGASATGFGGGLVTLPALSGGATATGIAVQTSNGIVSGVAVSGQAPGTSTNSAILSRLSATGSIVSSFGTGGTYTIPSNPNVNAIATAVSAIPDSSDLAVAGAFAGPSDTNPRFGLARIGQTPAQTMHALAQSIGSWGLPANGAGFPEQAGTVADELASGNTSEACADLTGLIHHAQAQSGKKLTPAQADQIINTSQTVSTTAGC